MRKEIDRKYREVMGQLFDEISSISEYQKYGSETDEESLKNITEEVMVLKQEDDTIGTHNLDVMMLSKLKTIYDLYVVIHPIIKHRYYKNEIKRLNEEIESIKENDNIIRANNSIQMSMRKERA